MEVSIEKFDKWNKWCGVICQEIRALYEYKIYYNNFMDVIRENEEHIDSNDGLYFCNFVRECYGGYAAIGVRRQLDCRDDSISLMRLLKDMMECADTFTYDFYITQYPISGHEWQRGLFKEFSEDGKSISKCTIKCHIKEIKDGCSIIKTFVNKNIAHLDNDFINYEATYDELEKSLELIRKYARKYNTFISGDSDNLKPSILFDSTRIFKVPLDISSPIINHEYQGYVFSIEYMSDNKSYVVDFPDIPEIITRGRTLDEAFHNACEALDLHLESLKELGLPLPRKTRKLAVIPA